VPGAGSAAELGDALGDDFAVVLGFGFVLAVCAGVGVGEAVGFGEGRAASTGVASTKAKASRPTTARECCRQDTQV